jgi:hypothetical protein
MQRELSTKSLHITGAPNLDAILVCFTDFGPGKGMVTLVCFGNAWSAYFGSMGGGAGSELSIREFFLGAGTDYLTNKLGGSQVLKQGKQQTKYLSRVIAAVKAELGAPRAQ